MMINVLPLIIDASEFAGSAKDITSPTDVRQRQMMITNGRQTTTTVDDHQRTLAYNDSRCRITGSTGQCYLFLLLLHVSTSYYSLIICCCYFGYPASRPVVLLRPLLAAGAQLQRLVIVVVAVETSCILSPPTLLTHN